VPLQPYLSRATEVSAKIFNVLFKAVVEQITERVEGPLSLLHQLLNVIRNACKLPMLMQ
jgi:hypothetical protein